MKRCLDSLIGQTYRNIEIILVDDGSPDDCGAICDEYAKRDARICVIHKENGGQSSARNMALDICTGDYLLFVDSDDWIENDAIEKLYHYISIYDCDCIVFNHYAVYEKKKILFDTTGNCLYSTEEIKHKYIMDYWFSYIWDKFYKRRVWENIRFPVGMTYEDRYVMPALMKNCESICCVLDALYYYDRSNMGSTTKVIRAKNLYDMYRGWRQIFEEKYELNEADSEYCQNQTRRLAVEAFYLNFVDGTLSLAQVQEIEEEYGNSLYNGRRGKLRGYIFFVKYAIKKKLSNQKYIWHLWRKYLNMKRK